MIIGERVAELGPEYPEGADVLNRDVHDLTEDQLDHSGTEVSPPGMRQFFRNGVDDVVAFPELVKERGQLFRRMLQVVVHRDRDWETRRAYSAEGRVMLTKVPAQPDADDVGNRRG